MPAARRRPAPPAPPRPRPAPPPPPRPAPRAAPRPAPPAPRPAPRPTPRPAGRPAAPQGRPAPHPSTSPRTAPRARPAPRPASARKAPTGRHAPGRRPIAHAASPAGPHAPAQLTEAERYQADYVSIGRQEGASELAILAALCAGYGENGWNAHTCNSRGYCGTWQLSPTLQREHDYRDVPYWTRRAYKDGFWGKGGLVALAKRYSTHSAGYIANLCQGAYSNLDQGAQYYDKYLDQARALYARIAGNAAAYGVLPASGSPPPPERALYVNPLAHARVRGERVDQGVDYAGTGYLVAIADGIVTESVANGSGWEGEAYLEYKVTQPGELEGVYIYGAEGLNPVVHKGEHVRAGSRIADLRNPMPHGIELGFAAGTRQWSYYRYHDGVYDEKSSTRPGIAFNNLVVRLGGPSGIVSRDVTGKFPEYMQSGEPAPTVSKEPPSGVTGNPLGGGVFMSGQFDWPGSVLSAFVQLQRGAGNGSHHSHAAWFAARAITYVTKSD